MKKKIKKEREQVYRLHIDMEPHAYVSHVAKPKVEVKKQAEPPKIEIKKQPELQKVKIKKQPEPPKVKVSGKKPSKIWAFIRDKVQFALVSAVVFVVIYVVLNWQALATNLQYYWGVWNGVESPLEQLIAPKQNEPERLAAVEIKGGEVQDQVPYLNLEIYPPDMRIVIPRINQNVPVVGVKNENLIARKWDDLEGDIQKSLRNGVIHYPGTALPGDNGNVVLTGHSSYYAWDAGRFKDVFALLHQVKNGDKIVVYFNQKKFIYEVFSIKVVLPKDVDVLAQTQGEQLTLITCTPVGTNLKRLVVSAKLVGKN
ncbi:class E sortase [Candidatus Peregrinibacteria bacterium]|nr:class E sortase [Candidatus Peregrinibacteria bacterium]